jgi:hypothetical protein
VDRTSMHDSRRHRYGRHDYSWPSECRRTLKPLMGEYHASLNLPLASRHHDRRRSGAGEHVHHIPGRQPLDHGMPLRSAIEVGQAIRDGRELSREEREWAGQLIPLVAQHLYERSGCLFITGYAGEYPVDGLPDLIFVSPGYGADDRCTQAYERCGGNDAALKALQHAREWLLGTFDADDKMVFGPIDQALACKKSVKNTT